MFIDEQTLKPIHANLGQSVIHGTLRACDLAPVFMDVIRDTPEYEQIILSNLPSVQAILDGASEYDEIWETEDMQYFLNCTLFEILNNYAPDGYYFGTLEGDGSDFGYWKIEE